MGNVVGSRENYGKWKAPSLQDHLTLQELCDVVGKHKTRIVQLEKEGVIPAPVRIKKGRHQVRLYSPDEVATIVKWFNEHGGKSGPRYAHDRRR